MKKLSEKMFIYFQKIVIVILLVSLVFSTYFTFFELDKSSLYLWSIIKNPQYMFYMAVLLLGVSSWLAFRYIDRCTQSQSKYIKIILWCILGLGQIFILYMFQTAPRTDSFIVQDQALAIVKGIDQKIDYTSTWYFTRYGNNNLYLVISVFLYKLCELFGIQDQLRFFAIFNIFMIDGSVFLACKTAALLNKQKLEIKVLLLSVMNPLNYLLIYWTYTCTYSLPVGVAIVYLSIYLLHGETLLWKRVLCGIGVGILAVIGYLLRPTSLIPLIAIFCCGWMYTKKEEKRKEKYLIICAGFLLSVTISFFAFTKIVGYYSDESGEKQNFPVTHWIMMGMHEQGGVNQEDNQYTTGFASKEDKTKANMEEIFETVGNYGVSGLLNHYIDKLEMTWSDGSGEYHGRLITDQKFSRAFKWIAGERKDFVMIYCSAYRVILLAGALYSVYIQKKHSKNNWLFLFSLTVFGGMIFYFFWEGKSVYSVPFLPFLIFLTADGMQNLAKKDFVLKKELVRKILVGIIGFTMIMSICNYWNFVKKENVWKSSSVAFTDTSFLLNEDKISVEGQELVQEFYTKKNFNEISIYCSKIENKNCSYKVQLVSKDGIEQEFKVDEENIVSNYLTLKFRTIEPVKKEKYQIRIIPETPGKADSISWKRRFSKIVGSYDGDCMVDGEQTSSDLALNVYMKSSEPYMGRGLYLLLTVFVFGWEIFLVYLWSRESRRKSI